MLVEPKESVSLRRGQHKGGKGKPKNGAGKGAGSLEQGDQVAGVEQQPQPTLASSLDLASFWSGDFCISTECKDCAKLLHGNSSPTMAACVCNERLIMGME